MSITDEYDNGLGFGLETNIQDQETAARGAGMKKSKNLTFRVYDEIMELMLNYELVPGQRLVLVDLAKRLQVSRTPVNNALSMLAQEGYLDFVPNQGYSVHKLTRKEAEDLYELRDTLEIAFVAQAIKNSSAEMIARIEELMVAYEHAVSNRVHRALFIIDTDFHLAILTMAGNAHLLERYRSICRKIFLRISLEGLVLSRIQEIIIEHKELYEAIRNRDVLSAQTAVRLHHDNSRRSLWPVIFHRA